jgi:hypothetical protein
MMSNSATLLRPLEKTTRGREENPTKTTRSMAQGRVKAVGMIWNHPKIMITTARMVGVKAEEMELMAGMDRNQTEMAVHSTQMAVVEVEAEMKLMAGEDRNQMEMVAHRTRRMKMEVEVGAEGIPQQSMVTGKVQYIPQSLIFTSRLTRQRNIRSQFLMTSR